MPGFAEEPGDAGGRPGGSRLREGVRTTLTRLSRTGELPTLAPTAVAAMAIARDPEAGVEQLCRVVRSDVGLSARILRVANSAAYARRVPARTLSDAVLTLGLRKTHAKAPLIRHELLALPLLMCRHKYRCWHRIHKSSPVALYAAQ